MGVTEGQVVAGGTDVMPLKGRELRRFRRKSGMIFRSFNLVMRNYRAAGAGDFECCLRRSRPD